LLTLPPLTDRLDLLRSLSKSSSCDAASRITD
jgi:hypothetical protein